MKDAKYYEEKANTINHEAIIKNFMGEELTDVERESIKAKREISYALGFQYPQHLSRLFKKRVGCTPNEYRRQNSETGL